MVKVFRGALLPLLIIFISFILRADYINLLLKKNSENVITCYDCYRYALITEQRLKGYVPEINYLMDVPDFKVNEEANMLITYLGTPIVGWLRLSKETLYVIVPPLFATFFIFPLFLWAKMFSGNYTFLGGAILGTFNLAYWIRTSPGRFDTDFLILFFLFLTLWLVTLLAKENNREKSFVYALLSGLALNLFMWWYPKPIFTFLFLTSLLLGCVLFENTKKLIFIKALIFLVTTGVVNVIYGIKQFWSYVESRVFYVPSEFIPVSMSSVVSELQPVSYNHLLKATQDNELLLVSSFLGLALLFIMRSKYMLIASPFIAMGFSAFVAGNRMLIYLSPFIGLGIGFLVDLLNHYLNTLKFGKLKSIRQILLIFITFIVTFPPSVLVHKGKLLFSEEFYNELSSLKTKLVEGAYIWTWWDLGNVIQYATKRGTYIDNGNWNIVKSFAVAHSFISDDFNRVKKLISYVSNERELSIKYRDKTYKDFLIDVSKYSKPLRNRVYILLSPDLLIKPFIRNLGSYGTTLIPKNKLIASDIHFCENEGNIKNCYLIKYDIKDKSIEDLSINVASVFIYDRDNKKILKEHLINPAYDYILFFIKDSENYYAVSIDKDLISSNIVRWMLLKEHPEDLCLIYDRFPLLVVYEVSNESCIKR